MSICEDCICRKYCGDDDVRRCDRYFKDSRIKKEKTNEEWLRNLSFNELARVLYCMIINGERIRPDLAYIKRWLKEAHDEM